MLKQFLSFLRIETVSKSEINIRDRTHSGSFGAEKITFVVKARFILDFKKGRALKAKKSTTFEKKGTFAPPLP